MITLADTVHAIGTVETKWYQIILDFPNKKVKEFICLSMSEKYISSHFDEIVKHGCDIEKRLDDTDCTMEWLIDDNKKIRNGFSQAGEQVILIDEDYESAIGNLL